MRESTLAYRKEIMALIENLSSIASNISILVSAYTKLDEKSDNISATQQQVEDAIYTEADTFHTKYVKIVSNMQIMYDDIFQYSEDCAMPPTPSTIDVDIECYSDFSTDLSAFYDICRELSDIVAAFSNTLKTFKKNHPTEENA